LFRSALVVLGFVVVYLSPRSIPAFLVFAAAVGLPYFLTMKKAIKLALAVLVAVVLVPILGARNIFYLEVIFQIAVFSALALGLNIVVGFSGLLNFGYMAFYAVGAYLWAFFGSQQPFLLNAIPGTVPPGTQFFMAPGLVLPIHLPRRHSGRYRRPAARPAGPAGARRLSGYHNPRLRRDRAPACQQPGQAH
jgi:hypothetical protein